MEENAADDRVVRHIGGIVIRDLDDDRSRDIPGDILTAVERAQRFVGSLYFGAAIAICIAASSGLNGTG